MRELVTLVMDSGDAIRVEVDREDLEKPEFVAPRVPDDRPAPDVEQQWVRR